MISKDGKFAYKDDKVICLKLRSPRSSSSVLEVLYSSRNLRPFCWYVSHEDVHCASRLHSPLVIYDIFSEKLKLILITILRLTELFKLMNWSDPIRPWHSLMCILVGRPINILVVICVIGSCILVGRDLNILVVMWVTGKFTTEKNQKR